MKSCFNAIPRREEGIDVPIAIPRIDLFASLHELISTYPSPPALRESLLDHLHDHLRETLPSVPAAIKLSATRHLTSDLVGETLVDALKSANEQLIAAVRNAAGSVDSGVANVYAQFVGEWCGKEVDDSLVSSCLTSLPPLTRQYSFRIFLPNSSCP